jgi:hypothetical protein
MVWRINAQRRVTHGHDCGEFGSMPARHRNRQHGAVVRPRAHGQWHVGGALQSSGGSDDVKVDQGAQQGQDEVLAPLHRLPLTTATCPRPIVPSGQASGRSQHRSPQDRQPHRFEHGASASSTVVQAECQRRHGAPGYSRCARGAGVRERLVLGSRVSGPAGLENAENAK